MLRQTDEVGRFVFPNLGGNPQSGGFENLEKKEEDKGDERGGEGGGDGGERDDKTEGGVKKTNDEDRGEMEGERRKSESEASSTTELGGNEGVKIANDKKLEPNYEDLESEKQDSNKKEQKP